MAAVSGNGPIAGDAPMLEARGLDVLLGDYQVLWGAHLSIGPREIVALLGPNGAGKSTLMNTISGLLRPRAGEVVFERRPITGLPAHRIVREGLSHVLERRRLFPYLTVRQNDLLGAYNPAARAGRDAQLRRVTELFPIIATRADQPAHTLSGGEQQMVAIARGLMAAPRLLLLDEPSLGLSPKVTEEVFARIRDIGKRGVTVLLVEQNVVDGLGISDRGYVIENGRVTMSGGAADLLRDDKVRAAYRGL